MSAAVAIPPGSEVTWHDAECGGYSADLPVWERLAEAVDGPVLDLGAGTGRVALHLAARAHPVWAVEHDGRLLGALDARATERRLPAVPVCADVLEISLERRFELILAPMQLLHVLGGPEARMRALERARAHLRPGGLLAVSILADPDPVSGRPDPMPDVREVDGWIHSSLPLEVRVDERSIELIRLRQLVSPGGELTEERSAITLDRFEAADLEREAGAVGLRVRGVESVPETGDHVGSLVVMLEEGDGGV